MKTRSTIILVCAVLLSVALTASVFIMKNALTFDPFAEITIVNASGQVISTTELNQGLLDITVHDIKLGEKRSICFYSTPLGFSNGYSVTIHFVDGRTLHEGSNSISDGEKYEINVSKDAINTACTQSTTL